MSGQNDNRPSSAGSESTSDSSPPSSPGAAIANHDWVSRQLRLRRTEFTETLKAKIKIVSWNVNGKRIGEDLTDLLVENEEPGIYAIGLQEMDLGKGAYVVYDPTYETEWTAAIATVLGDHYEKVASHQLVGLFLIIFANKALIPAITSVQKSHLPTGHFALLGNKGAAAIRLQCYDSTICFVNVHLYHVADGIDKRRADIKRILRELIFDDAQSIKAHDLVFLFGDLNYRVSATTDDAKTLLDKGLMGELLLRDQLLTFLPTDKVFRGFKEPLITFPPTYKYDIGTTVFDTSEKNRCPSWTDRILWRSNLAIKTLSYTSFPLHVMSDHKPISAFFEVDLEAIIRDRYQDVHTSVLRELDRLENDARPTVSISTEELQFGRIYFLEPVTRSLTLENTSPGIAHFTFRDLQSNSNLNQKDYIFIRPTKGSLGPKESCSIDITILINNRTIPAVASGKPLDDILILEIRNGRHIFVSLQGDFQATCFGQSIEKLASYAGRGVRNIEPGVKLETGGGLPDELWRMTDFILSYGRGCSSLFLERGDEGVCRGIRECLDTAKEFDPEIVLEGDIGVLSMAETLLRFLDALPESVIPAYLYDKVIRLSESRGSVIQLMDLLPGPHANVLIFLISFIRQIFEWPVYLQNPETKRRIVSAFAKILIRNPGNARAEDTQRKEILMTRLLQE